MRKLWAILLIVAILLFVIPFMLKKTPEKIREIETSTDESCPIEITVAGLDKPLPLEEYIKGVVAAEMGASFHEEALKAQAIAARTYALKWTDNGKKPINGDVSAQVFLSENDRKKRWGKDFKQNERKISNAVEATKGEVLLYKDQLISAMFFSTSNGQTETAQNYSGNQVPYLQSVESPGEEDIAPKFNQKEEMPLSEWNEALGISWNQEMFKSLQLVRNQTGRVQKVVASGFEANGREMRERLGLASTDFDIAFDVTNNIVLINTTGYGHGVGMSQYGAEAFAKEGWTAEKILQHYYTGTIIKNFNLIDTECLKLP